MIKYKRYERYKDSGVEWIGEIPEHWNVTKLGYRARMIVPMRDKPTEFNGDIPWIRIEDVDGKYIEDSKSEQRVSKELVKKMNLKVYPIGTVLCTCSCNMGTTAIVKKPLISNQTFIGIVPMKDLDSTFLYYAMNANSKRLQHLAEGAIQQYLSRHDFEHLKLAFPNENEQIAIANFLDQKTAEIDGLIADKEKLIELLQEKRQAIITEAVTKGLNPNVKMKDSGIEWIGEIPEHWEVKKLKHVSNITMGQSPKSEECSYDEIGVPFLQGNAEFTNVHPIPKMYCNTANKFSKVNDILLSVRAPVGAINISDRVYGIGRGLCAITAKKVIMKYLWYSLNVSLEELFIKSKGSTFEAVTVTDVQNLLIILPPKNEQDDIVNFLDKKTAEIDGLVIEIKKQIEKLKEYRQSLISEAVTGKIYVRDYAID